jgi:hypothetical protein
MALEYSTNLGDDTRRFRVVDEGHSQLIRRPNMLNRGPAQIITTNLNRQSNKKSLTRKFSLHALPFRPPPPLPSPLPALKAPGAWRCNFLSQKNIFSLMINPLYDLDLWDRQIISEERDFEKQNENDLYSNFVIYYFEQSSP